MARGRYLLVGEAPARTGKRNLHACLAARALNVPAKAGLTGLLRTQHGELFDFVMDTRHANLLKTWPGAARRGSAFPMAEARVAADAFLEVIEIVQPEAILLAGRRVAAAFRHHMHHRGTDYFEHLELEGREARVVPHPSGVNRWWNDPANRERARKFLAELACRPGGWRESIPARRCV